MTDRVRAEMVGLADMKRAFDRLDRNARRETLSTAVLAALNLVQNEAARLAPKRTRTLAESIHSEIVKEEERYVEGAVGTDVEYGPYQEFGAVIPAETAKAWGNPIGRVVVIPAHPYLRPAWDKKLAAMKHELVTVLKALLQEGEA